MLLRSGLLDRKSDIGKHPTRRKDHRLPAQSVDPSYFRGVWRALYKFTSNVVGYAGVQVKVQEAVDSKFSASSTQPSEMWTFARTG
jgi:hypothetical protein